MIKNTARNHDELGRILDTCLELISNGTETVDTVIEQFPQYSDQLRPPLEAAMWLQSRKEVFNPRPGFVQLSQRRLVNRFREQPSNGGINETISRIPLFFQQHRIAVQYSALLTLTAVLLFVGYRSTDFLCDIAVDTCHQVPYQSTGYWWRGFPFRPDEWRACYSRTTNDHIRLAHQVRSQRESCVADRFFYGLGIVCVGHVHGSRTG